MSYSGPRLYGGTTGLAATPDGIPRLPRSSPPPLTSPPPPPPLTPSASPKVQDCIRRCQCLKQSSEIIASQAQWLRCPVRERQSLSLFPLLPWVFFGSSNTSDLQIGTLVPTPPGAWCYMGHYRDRLAWCQYTVKWGDSFICTCCLRVAAGLSLRYTSMLLRR